MIFLYKQYQNTSKGLKGLTIDTGMQFLPDQFCLQCPCIWYFRNKVHDRKSVVQIFQTSSLYNYNQK